MTPGVLVVGSGVIGLRTALELLRSGIRVAVRSMQSHQSSCSNGAGGLWMPYKSDDPRVTGRWATSTLTELLNMVDSHKRANVNDGDKELRPRVEVIDTLLLSNEKTLDLPTWTRDPRISFEQLSSVEMLSRAETSRLRIPPGSLRSSFGLGGEYGYVQWFRSPVVDAPNVLDDMLREISSHPLTVDVNTERKYDSIDDMMGDLSALGFNDVVNCTGTGAGILCQDKEITAGRGSLLHYPRDCPRLTSSERDIDVNITIQEMPWSTNPDHPSYMIARGDTIIIGGCCEEQAADCDKVSSLRSEERERLKSNAQRLGIDTSNAKSCGEWVGYRPLRPEARLDIVEMENGKRIVHCYGHGGSGWTVYVGVAKDVVQQLGYTV